MDFKLIECNEDRIKVIIQLRELVRIENLSDTPHSKRISMLNQLISGVKKDFLKEYDTLN